MQTLNRLLEALRIPALIAERSLNSVLVLILGNFASALWLTFFAAHTFSLSYALTGLIFLFTTLPGLCFIKLFLALQEIIALPKRLIDFYQTSGNKYVEYRQFQEQLRAKIQDKNIQIDDLKTARKGVVHLLAFGKRLRDAFALSSKLKDVKTLLNDSVEFRKSALNAVLLANPLFIAMTTLSLIANCLWTLAALTTLLIYLK